MSRPKHEVAEIIERFGKRFIEKHAPNTFQLSVLGALSVCRTSALGGHKYRCDHCGREHTVHNSCKNRHCPKCQSVKQAFWVEDRIRQAYPVKHYHIVFTIPDTLNAICRINSKWFYNALFAAVWDTLRSFGYTHYGAEGGSICLLHTWGQNISLHPHIHCIVPAAGYSIKGRMKNIGKGGKYLYPVRQLSVKFRGLLMSKAESYLVKQGKISGHSASLEKAWKTPWVVFCEPSFGKPDHVVGYLGQYTHRVAITNQRIVSVDDRNVRFRLKDYRDQGRAKTITLAGEEFLRRFCMHILPKGFVKIRHYGICSTRFRNTVLNDKHKMVIKPKEATHDRIKRILGFDTHRCPLCKKGQLVVVAIIPRIRSPGFAKLAAGKTHTT